MSRVFSALKSVTGSTGGAGHVNLVAHEAVAARFDMADSAADAGLQIGTTIQKLPAHPPRFFLDHGAFADATWWAFVAPVLNSRDTIAVTSRVCRDLAAHMWDSNGPAIVDLPLFADTAVFRPADDRDGARRALARRLGIDEAGPWILAVGSYSARKNTHLAVLALKALRERLPSARLLLVLPPSPSPGQQAAASFLETTIRESGQDDAIVRLPPRTSPELAELMAASDLLIHLTTCRIENFGLVVAEAMASGLPVLAADWGGLRDLVVPGTTGWLAPTHLSSRGPRVRWRNGIDEIAGFLADETRWSAMSRAARERASEFSKERFEERLIDAIEGELSGTGVERGPTLSSDPEDLKFATIWLQTRHPEVRDTSTFFRRLLDLEDGRFATMLLAPAATSAAPPPLAAGSHVSPAVAYTVVSDRLIRVDEPGSAEELTVTPEAARLARRLAPGAVLASSDVEAADELARLGLV